MTAIDFDDFRFDPADGQLSLRSGTGAVRLRPQAARLLEALVENADTVVGRETLYREVWGEDAVVDFESGLAALMRELRRAFAELGASPDLIETVPRRGYRLHADPGTGSGYAGAPASGRRRFLAGVAIAFAGLAILMAAAWFGYRALQPPGGDRTGEHSLAIVPPERAGPVQPGRNTGILLADNLLAELWTADLENLVLIGRAGMRPYAGRDDVAAAVAEALGVDLLMEGSLRAGADGWRVDVRVLAIPPGRVIWSQTLLGSEPELPASQVAARLVDQFAADWPQLQRDLVP